MNYKSLVAAVVMALGIVVPAYAEADIVIKYNGEALCFSEQPIIRNDKTLVQLRPIAEAMNLNIEFVQETGEVVLSDSETTVVFVNNSDIIKVNGCENTMIAPAIIYHDYTFVPIRDLAEPFGEIVSYDSETKMVSISNEVEPEHWNEAPVYEEEMPPVYEDESLEEYPEDSAILFPLTDVASGSGKYASHYYCQAQTDLPFENKGRGFCWVCSYAMVISNVSENKVTPIEVANVNLENGFGANVTYHSKIVEKFGCEFIPALSEDSVYFAGFDTLCKGETTVKFEDEAGVIAALKEMLDASPEGILVRYDCYPHTMMAVGYDGDTIYFNDPGVLDGEHVPFEKTCLKNYKLTDLSYVQKIRKIEE